MCTARDWHPQNTVQSYSPSIYVYLTTGPQPLSNQVLHILRSIVSTFNSHHPFLSLRSSVSCVRLLPRLPVTCSLPSILRSITYLKWQFQNQMWPIHQASLLFIVCRIFFSSLTLRAGGGRRWSSCLRH